MSSKQINREMLENAVFQQLFLGEKLIQGKNPEHTMQLTGIDQLLNRFMDDLESNLNLIAKLKIKEFIKKYETTFSLKLNQTTKRIMTNLDNMGGIEQLEGQETIVIYIVLTKLVEALREKAYKTYGREQINVVYQKAYNKPLDKKREDKIQNLAATNNPSISLLYNLTFIMFLAQNYGSKKFQTTIKRLTSMRINRIVSKLK